jgi:hypothetical protein
MNFNEWRHNISSCTHLIASDICYKTFEDIKGVIRSRKSKKDRQYNDQKEKGQDRQYNDQKKKNNNLQNTKEN